MSPDKLIQLFADLFSSFKFDLTTALITLILIPVGAYLWSLLRSHVRPFLTSIFEAATYQLSRRLRHSISARISLRHYCRARLDGDEAFLQVPSSKVIRLPIDQMYVPLVLEKQGRSASTYTHENVLTSGNRIIIAGDAGSGKSSLLKLLFRQECRKVLNRRNDHRLPIRVELRNLRIPAEVEYMNLGKWFVDYLRDLVQQTPSYKMDEYFDSYCTQNGLLVLLDGLDEVSSNEFARVSAAIDGLCSRLQRFSTYNSVLITMRTQFYQELKGIYEEIFPTVTFIRQFTPADIYEFLTRWPYETDQANLATQIFNALSDRPTLREMCSNPLVLSMYVADVQNAEYEVIPETRTEFYNKVIEELLVKRRARQIEHLAARTKLREQREQILGTLAYGHLLDPTQPANSLLWSEGLRIVQSVTGCQSEEAESRFRELARETGLIAEERPSETFRFVHLTFAEFLCAKQAVEDQADGWRNLVATQRRFEANGQPAVRSRLIEVIPFAAGLLMRVQRNTALDDLLAFADWRLLIRAFMETKYYEHPHWPVFLRHVRDQLRSKPEKHLDPKWLRDLHLFNVVVDDANRIARHIASSDASLNLSEFYGSLVLEKKNSVSKLLTAYASQDAAAAFHLAARSRIDLASSFPDIIVRHCDQKPLLGLIIQQVIHDKARSQLWAGLLCESAMRYLVVANTLNSMPHEKELILPMRMVPKNERWYYRNILPLTFYTQLLTISRSPLATSWNRVSLLSLKQALKAPAAALSPISIRYLDHLDRFPRLALLLAAAVPILFAVIELVFASNQVIAVAGRAVLLMLVIFGWFSLRQRELRSFYFSLLFPDSTTSNSIVNVHSRPRKSRYAVLLELISYLRSRSLTQHTGSVNNYVDALFTTPKISLRPSHISDILYPPLSERTRLVRKAKRLLNITTYKANIK